MPERDKIVLRVGRHLVGAEQGENTALTSLLAMTPHGIRRAQWQGLQAILDYLLIEVIEHVDWKRVLLVAGSRHRELVEQDSSHATDDAMLGIGSGEEDPVCGVCLNEALLSESTMGPGKDGTPVERHPLWRKEWLEEAGGAEQVVTDLFSIVLRAAANGHLEARPDLYEEDDA